ncbi:MAG TPA: hypothetical protein PKB06_08390, partial [Actinotalea sp.]|nr:hypothetical protein [Actinotalea sp.]
MHADHRLVEARLDRFVRDRLTPAVHRDHHALTAQAWVAPGEPVPFADAVARQFEPVPLGWRWGRAW